MKIKKLIKYLFILLIVLFSACSNNPAPDRIIDRSIKKHGGEIFEKSVIEFDFREAHYIAKRNEGLFQFEKILNDSTGKIHHVYDNTGFNVYINGNKQDIDEKDKNRYLNSLNSVIYFALLPYKLNDAAVNKELLNSTVIEGDPYYEIKVTFDKQGGGKDYEDEFIYWIHQEDFTMDYLAYRFHVDEGGTRFRKAFNIRNINGIRIADYYNFKGPDNAAISEFDQLYESGELEKVSEIILKNVKVQHL